MAIAIGVPASAATAASAAPAGQPVRASVAADLKTLKAADTTEFMVYLRDSADLSAAAAVAGAAARATHVYEQLTGTATRTQAGVISELTAAKVEYRSYWIANVLWVKGTKALIDSLATRKDVARIEAPKSRPLIKPVIAPASTVAAGPEWGLLNIEAPRVWSDFGVRGEGIVVANIDGGVDFSHPALVSSYRGNLGNGQFDHNYNWFDPSRSCANPSLMPCDDDGHGTHTMGTMVGDDGAGNQIGVAPGARWMAARGCETNFCSDPALLASGQFVLAPTDLNGANPRPDLHADVVNNSWGGGNGDLLYQQTIRSWIAAGIFPAFANGNTGPACGTAESPGDNPEAYAVGAYDINNVIAGFSSRGSSAVDGGLKPNIAAPGVAVRSSIPGGYVAANGTSMATPHVSGTVALIWSAAPTIKGDIAATRTLLDTTAADVDATTCGGTPADNNVFGEGRLNAFQAVTAAPRGDAGRVVGTVTNAATGAALSGVKVASGGTSTFTGPDGRYALTLLAGPHTVTASTYGFATQSADVVVTIGSAVTQDFALVALPMVTVTGRVTDGSGKAFPLYARIDVTGRPGGPIFTNPATGRFTFQIAGNTTYSIVTGAVSGSYREAEQQLVVGAGNKTHNISLLVDAVSCTAPGYAFPSAVRQPFDTTATPAGWEVVNRTPSGGWVFNDPEPRGNLTGGSGGFAIMDSDNLGAGNAQDTDLITPMLDLSTMDTPTLRFNSDYRGFSNGFADVDVSIDGGTTWTNLWHQTTESRRGPTVETIVLTPAANQANVRVRFHYTGSFAWWWQLDNVEVIQPTCTPQPGGMVVGFVTDKNTGAALNGVAVSNGTVSATTASTPDDPSIGDGFYSLFSTPGAQTLTATRAPYLPLSKNVTVVDNTSRQVNFVLKAARLEVNPTALTGHVPFGASRSTTVTVKNTGSAPATVNVFESGGSFQILNGLGSQVVMQNIPGGAPKGKVNASGVRMMTRAAPRIDESWTSIANYPVSEFDNAAAFAGGKLYVVGNSSGSVTDSAFVYDPETNTWAALPASPHGRAKPQVVSVRDKVYVFGGWNDTGTEPAVDVYDPASNTWSTVAASNPAPRAAAGAAVVGGKVYLIGGCPNFDCVPDSDNTVVFDTANGSFDAGSPIPQSRSWASCGGIGGRVYCAGGFSGATSTNTAVVYNPAGDTWSSIANMPLDLWASADSTANGMLIMAGGVTDGLSTVTNRTIAYNPDTNTWSDLPAAGFARYRGAGACGVYKVTGAISGTTPSNTAERLGGLDLCGGVANLPWLNASPATFTLSPGQSRNLTVTLSAGADSGVIQPGSFTAELGFNASTPYIVPRVDVTMNVLPPPNWGKITGVIAGKPCTGSPVGIAATIRINLVNSPDIGYSLRSRGSGRYDLWLPAGRYDVIVAKDGWIPEVARVRIDAGFVLTHNPTLEPFTPC